MYASICKRMYGFNNWVALPAVWIICVDQRNLSSHTVHASLHCRVQAAHHVSMRERLVAAVDEIKSVMESMHGIFKGDSEEVQREWVRFTAKVDKKMEDALRHTVKKSLQVRGCVAFHGGWKDGRPLWET